MTGSSRPSLRTVLAAAFGGIALVVALATSLLAGQETGRRLRAAALQELAGRARHAAELLDREMFARWRDLRVVAESPLMRDPGMPPEARRRMLVRLHETYSDCALLAFMAPDGQILVDSRGLLEGTNASGRSFFRKALAGPVAEDVHDALPLAGPLGRTAGDPPLRLVDLAAPVRDAAGRLIGVIGAHLDWHRVAEAVAPADGARAAMILARDGRVLHGPPDWLGRVVTASDSGEPVGLRDGGRSLAAAAPTRGHGDYPGLGWLVVMREDSDAATAPAQAAQRRILGFGLLAALAAALLGWWAAGLLARPLERLAGAAEAGLRHAPGSAAAPPPRPGGGFAEAAGLARALEGLRQGWHRAEAGLRKNEAAPRRADAEPEARVAERTAALAAEREELRRIYDRTPAALHSVDASGRILRVNAHWLAFLGYAREEVLGRRPSAFMPPESAARWDAAFDAPAAPATPACESEHRMRRRDGTPVEVLMRTCPELDAEGRFLRGHAVLLDLARRNRAEARLREAEKLEALGRIAGGVAHDFNNVLQVVTGALRLLDSWPGDPDRVRRYTGAALAAAERGAGLTRRLLAFAGRDQLRPGPVEAAPLLEGVAGLLRGGPPARDRPGRDRPGRESPARHGPDPRRPDHGQADEGPGAGIALEIVAPPGLPPVRADRMQLELVLFNLALNARDAMPGGGRLRLAAAPEVVDEAAPHPQGLAPGRYLRFTLEDSGAGMDAATLARATEPFFTTKEVGQGAGLGLAMAHGFAAQSGGALALASAPGRGTVVTLWLPVAEEAETDAPHP